MTITQQRTGAAVPSAWRRMRLWTVSQAVDDLYQGLVPSVVPYFVLDRHYGYVAASGLTLAATLGSSIPQPFFGVIAGRRNAGWMAGAGVGLAGLGLIATAHGPRGALLALLVVPPLALLCGTLLRAPG